MTHRDANESLLDRRGLLRVAAASGLGVAPGLTELAGPANADGRVSETAAHVIAEPARAFGDDLNTADIVVETLIAWQSAEGSLSGGSPKRRF